MQPKKGGCPFPSVVGVASKPWHRQTTEKAEGRPMLDLAATRAKRTEALEEHGREVTNAPQWSALAASGQHLAVLRSRGLMPSELAHSS